MLGTRLATGTKAVVNLGRHFRIVHALEGRVHLLDRFPRPECNPS